MMHDLFDKRRLEVFLSLATTGLGLWLLTPAESMGTAAFVELVKVMPEWQWGLAFFINGLCHALALAVNGSKWWSPMVRWWAAIFSVVLYISFSGGIWAAFPSSPGVFTYFALSCGSGLAAYWAWKDALRAVRIKYVADQR